MPEATQVGSTQNLAKGQRRGPEGQVGGEESGGPRPGKIFLVGLGPGAEAHLSLRARQALAEAEVIIGYGTYVKLIQHLLTHQEVVRKGMTEELDRCLAAFEYARRGRRVALISSGDIGVYGMAGPTFEVLLRSGWRPGGDIEVEVIPGITSLSACASLIGAPLTHDFCSISLSDLLTPWPLIARRLAAAARGDFVIALYNPRSGRRAQHLIEAQIILLRHRSPETPVAIVTSAYREGQEVQLTRLADLADARIGMLSTVLVGNASTYVQDGLMVTPRGYGNKYDGQTGDTREGERAGRSLSLGLEGWQAHIEDRLRRLPGTSLGALAQDLDIPLGALLQAIGTANPMASPGDLIAVPVNPGAELAVLAAAADWGPVRIESRNPAGAVAEWRLHRLPCHLEENGETGRLVIGTPDAHLRIDTSRIARAWFLRQGRHRRELHLLDAADEVLLTLALIDPEQTTDPQPEVAYLQTWETLSAPLS